ncbi:MAG: DUF1573 domain-containing protein [Bacteroidales bacterium]
MFWRGLVVLLILALLFSCSGQNGRNVTNPAVELDDIQSASLQADISFDKLSHDFGTIIEGEMVVCYFEYENIGNGDLIITSVEATCGCTSPDWDKEPLKPGEREQLKVVFDSNGRSGSQLKGVTVNSNSLTPEVRLTLKANVTNNK